VWKDPHLRGKQRIVSAWTASRTVGKDGSFYSLIWEKNKETSTTHARHICIAGYILHMHQGILVDWHNGKLVTSSCSDLIRVWDVQAERYVQEVDVPRKSQHKCL